jgi:hypothetical protein
LHIRAKAALITIPADKAMPGIGTVFTSLEQSANGTFLPHRRIFRCEQGRVPASVIFMLHCYFLPECKKRRSLHDENFGAFYADFVLHSRLGECRFLLRLRLRNPLLQIRHEIGNLLLYFAKAFFPVIGELIRMVQRILNTSIYFCKVLR